MLASDVSQSGKEYWDTAAATYDQDFADTLIGRSRREAVWRELDLVFCPGQRILELNCGTGIDAMHLAERGMHVLACDIASRMIELGRQRVNGAKTIGSIEFRTIATEEIGTLAAEGPFDGALSNFSGLNCVADLSAVARNLSRLLKPQATVLLCIAGRFVPWEILWFLAHAEPRKAVRRFHRNTVRQLETGSITIRYHSVKEAVRSFAPWFDLRKRKGVGICVPPSYLEHWARRFPGLMKRLARADRWVEDLPIARATADCVLLEFERRARVGE